MNPSSAEIALTKLKESMQALDTLTVSPEASPILEKAWQSLAELDQAFEDSNAENARLMHSLDEQRQSKTRFLSIVVHELRIPMTAIKGYADLLRQNAVGPLSEAQAGFIDVIRNNVNRMADLVSDLSDLNRAESGRLKLEPVACSFPTRTKEALKTLEDGIAKKQQSLQIEMPADLPQVYADPQRATQVISILLKNAHLYTPDRGSLRLSARTLEGGAAICVEVSDNGIGVGEEEREKLFSPFFRSEVQAVREQQGWGLGLSVARLLVEAMGGQIGYDSESHQGSTFWFTLPVETG